MRLFIAIELPQQLKDKLAALQMQLKKSGADVKWVSPHNIHLTLKFLGETGAERLPGIIAAMENAAHDTKPFQASLSFCGAFPKIEFPRVIWVAIDKGENETKLLAQRLEDELKETGIPKEERIFTAHLTIGRVSSPQNKAQLVKSLKEAENYFGGQNIEFGVNRITLFKSTLGPGGPSYEALKEVNLTTS